MQSLFAKVIRIQYSTVKPTEYGGAVNRELTDQEVLPESTYPGRSLNSFVAVNNFYLYSHEYLENIFALAFGLVPYLAATSRVASRSLSSVQTISSETHSALRNC